MELAEAAKKYAELGWAVLPLRAKGKEPAIKNGCLAASNDVAKVESWWGRQGNLNIGVATGAKSGGLVVIDLDVDEESGENGIETLFDWEGEHGKLPNTVTACTGRGGMHLYFSCDEEIRNSTNKALGIDIRGEGGYVMVAPSMHPNGKPYMWSRSPFEGEVAKADERVLSFIEFVRPRKKAAGSGAGGGKSERFILPQHIGAGERNDTLFRYGSSLQSRGASDTSLKASLMTVNAERCEPPLPDADIETIYESIVERYEKGQKRHFRKLDRRGNPTGAVLHHEVGLELIEKSRACTVDGGPAIWTGDHYATGWDAVSRAILQLVPDCTKRDRTEVHDYLHLEAPKLNASRASLIAVKNGVYDMEARELVPMEEDMVITNVVPHEYVADAYDEVVDSFLRSAGSKPFVSRVKWPLNGIGNKRRSIPSELSPRRGNSLHENTGVQYGLNSKPVPFFTSA